MATSAGRLIRNIAHLAPGEGLSRLCSVVTVIFLGHRYGVVILGVYALAATLSQYLQPIIDFGLRHIGARLVAQRPQLVGEIVRRVQRRRLRMAAAVLPLLVIYAVAVKLPMPMKVFLLVFSFSSALYAVSLDWAAWGKNQLHLVGFARAIVPASILAFVLLGHGNSRQVLWWVVAGNVFGYLVQAVFFWLWWKKHQPRGTAATDEQMVIADSLAWRRSSIMGLAWLSNLAFNSVDMLMLGLMSNPVQVGLYSAAYRILNQVLVGYYLLTQSLYPELSRQNSAQRIRMLRARILLGLLGAGVVIATALMMVRRPLLTLLFGHQFLTASPLLFLLVWAIPLDFLTSYLGNAYIAWGMERKILLCTVIGAGSNILLNLFWIPIYGAAAAAVDTLLSYLIFLVSLVLVGRFAKELARDTRAMPELAT
ncbi:MAG: polysaccharide biosynthesis C-terminal domain-containing protein [Candidatus Korobacteraceae bacterium]|jgi:O-antigen/teichoic acid export membrane protein